MRDEAAVQQIIPVSSANLVPKNQHHFEVASQNTKPQRDLSKYEKQVNRRIELVSKIGVLEYLFQRLLRRAACGIDNSYVERIVLVLVQAISRHNENTHLSDYVEELEGIKNVSEIIQYLVKNHFCGCLNYILLANLIEAFGNEECKETLSEYIEEYNKFAKDVKLAELIQPYLTDAEISKGCLIGLPEIVLTVENPGSWMQRAYSTFSSVWNSLVSPVRYFLKSVGAGSLEITHAIFPEDFPTVKENLEKNRSFLEKLGIKARIVMDPNNPHDLNQSQTLAPYRRPSRMSKIFSDLAETLGQKTTESMRAIHKDFEDFESQENQQIADLETKFYHMVEEIHDEMKTINERLNKVERKSNATTPGETRRRISTWTRSRSSKRSVSEYEESSNRARSRHSKEEVEEIYKHEEIYTDVPVFTESSTNVHTSSSVHNLHLPELAQSSKSSLVERAIGDKDSRSSFLDSPSKTNLTRMHKQELPQENIHKETNQKFIKGIQSKFSDSYLEGAPEPKKGSISTSNSTYLHVYTFPKQPVLSQLTQTAQLKERPRRNAGTATKHSINSGHIKSTGTKLKRTKQPKNK